MKNKLLITTALVAIFSVTNAYADTPNPKGTIIGADEQITVSENVSGKKALLGGAYFNEGTLNINDNVQFTNNFANVAGGSIYNNGILTIGNNVTFNLF